jgi:hypothetical protein
MRKAAIGVSAALMVSVVGFLMWQAEAAPRGDLIMSPAAGLLQQAACVRVCSVWGVCWKYGKPRRCCSHFICK